MRREVLSRLKAAEPEIPAFGVGTLSLFGSVARDEAGETSDVDLFVEPSTASFYDLSNSMGAYRRLRDGLARGRDRLFDPGWAVTARSAQRGARRHLGVLRAGSKNPQVHLEHIRGRDP